MSRALGSMRRRGWIETGRRRLVVRDLAALTDESRRERAAQTLVGREGTPEEIASLIAWLLGPDGGWMTGQVLSPNGGVVPGR